MSTEEVLRCLRDNGPLTVPEIKKLIHRDASSIHTSLRRLEEDGTARRARTVKSTDTGMRCIVWEAVRWTRLRPWSSRR